MMRRELESGRAARRSRRAGSAGSGDGHAVPFRGLLGCIFDGRSRQKRLATGRRVLKTRHKLPNKPAHLTNFLGSLDWRNDGRRMTDRSRSGPVDGTACSPRKRQQSKCSYIIGSQFKCADWKRMITSKMQQSSSGGWASQRSTGRKRGGWTNFSSGGPSRCRPVVTLQHQVRKPNNSPDDRYDLWESQHCAEATVKDDMVPTQRGYFQSATSSSTARADCRI
ncbi:hypothetical protein B0H16DRAFT_886481 [Mycena metata]|uniref:Uncharacterized protein n=1 Tax=Mycena metata TaxID=1033252 RepID=A0AAD7K4T5_9AGAR|nr:hypothetical protein B0H16DRAFT_886481 [Mycena metata]